MGSKLVLEDPKLATTPVLPRVDTVSEMEKELAEYAKNNFGYKALSDHVVKRERAQSAPKDAEKINRLPQALIGAGIQVYNPQSVKKYQSSMIRKAWAKTFIGPDSISRFMFPTLVSLAVATSVLAGWLSIAQATIMAVLGCLPAIPLFIRESRTHIYEQQSKIVAVAIVSVLMFGSTLGVCLSALTPWTFGITYVLGSWMTVLGSLVLSDSTKKTKIYWQMVDLGSYAEEIPLFALSMARQIHREVPEARFFVEAFRCEHTRDPFLIVRDPATGSEFYIAVWGEPKFEAKNRL